MLQVEMSCSEAADALQTHGKFMISTTCISNINVQCTKLYRTRNYIKKEFSDIQNAENFKWQLFTLVLYYVFVNNKNRTFCMSRLL